MNLREVVSHSSWIKFIEVHSHSVFSAYELVSKKSWNSIRVHQFQKSQSPGFTASAASLDLRRARSDVLGRLSWPMVHHGPSWSIMVHHGPLKAFGLCSRQQVSKPFTAFESNVFLVVSECWSLSHHLSSHTMGTTLHLTVCSNKPVTRFGGHIWTKSQHVETLVYRTPHMLLKINW